MRSVLAFLSGFVFVALLASCMNARAEDFDAVTWAGTPEGAAQIAGYFSAGLFFPLMGYVIAFAAGALLRMIGR